MYLFYRIMYKLIQNEYYMSHQNTSAAFSLFIFILPLELSPGGDSGEPGWRQSDSFMQCFPTVMCFDFPSLRAGEAIRSMGNWQWNPHLFLPLPWKPACQSEAQAVVGCWWGQGDWYWMLWVCLLQPLRWSRLCGAARACPVSISPMETRNVLAHLGNERPGMQAAPVALAYGWCDQCGPLCAQSSSPP